MLNALQHDVGAFLSGFLAMDFATITAGAGNDATEVNGNVLDMLANPPSPYGPALSVQVVIPYKAVLAATKTLAAAANLQHAPVSTFASGALDYPLRRARVVSAGGVVTKLPLDANGNLPTTVIATGGGGGTTERGVLLLDADLSSVMQYLRLQRTMDLNASGTDTTLDGAIFVLGGMIMAPLSAA